MSLWKRTSRSVLVPDSLLEGLLQHRALGPTPEFPGFGFGRDNLHFYHIPSPRGYWYPGTFWETQA
jgi:hypothetical protein